MDCQILAKERRLGESVIQTASRSGVSRETRLETPQLCQHTFVYEER